jgi:hypothetical protein
MLPPLATLDQLKDRIDVYDDTRAEAALEDASTLVRTFAGKTWVDEEGELEPDIPDAITLVTLSVAARKVTNPSGYSYEQIGQYARRIEGQSGGSLYLTEDEKDMIREALGLDSVRTIQLVNPALRYRGEEGYVDVVGGSPFPVGSQA